MTPLDVVDCRAYNLYLAGTTPGLQVSWAELSSLSRFHFRGLAINAMHAEEYAAHVAAAKAEAEAKVQDEAQLDAEAWGLYQVYFGVDGVTSWRNVSAISRERARRTALYVRELHALGKGS